LIPLISKRENDEGFIARACANGDELFLLLVVDTEAIGGQFGFAASEIGQGNSLMQEIKQIAKEHGKEGKDIIEWGDTETKILHFAQLQNIDKIFLVQQDNQFFKKLVKELREKTGAEVETVYIPG